MTDTDSLIIYTVYDHPLDFPGFFVIKRDIITLSGKSQRDDDFIILTTFRHNVTEIMRRFGLVRIDRHPADHPIILETWL